MDPAVTSRWDELMDVLTHCGRLQLLVRLKELGIPLPARQKAANEMGRMLREGTADTVGLPVFEVDEASAKATGAFEFDPYTFAEVLVPEKFALKGRPRRSKDMGMLDNQHLVLGTALLPPWPSECRTAVFAAGCFWGLEKGFWRLPGVHSTSAGFIGGFTPHPTYTECCTGLTGHTEAVLVVYDPERIAYVDLLRWFWQCHDPTQGMGQGKDRGTQYRSMIVTQDAAQHALAQASLLAYQRAIAGSGRTFTASRRITVEIVPPMSPTAPLPPPSSVFFYAEEYHMQYLARPSSSPYCTAQPLLIDLPPYASWAPAGLGEDERASHAPRLSDAFWAKHGPEAHCALNRPNEPICL